jgi:hypothetical protein
MKVGRVGFGGITRRSLLEFGTGRVRARAWFDGPGSAELGLSRPVYPGD